MTYTVFARGKIGDLDVVVRQTEIFFFGVHQPQVVAAAKVEGFTFNFRVQSQTRRIVEGGVEVPDLNERVLHFLTRHLSCIWK